VEAQICKESKLLSERRSGGLGCELKEYGSMGVLGVIMNYVATGERVNK